MLYGFIIPGLGGTELLVLIGLGVLLFGRKLPDIGRMIGRTVVEVRNGFNGVEEGVREPVRVQSPPPRVTSVEKPSFEGVPAKV